MGYAFRRFREWSARSVKARRTTPGSLIRRHHVGRVITSVVISMGTSLMGVAAFNGVAGAAGSCQSVSTSKGNLTALFVNPTSTVSGSVTGSASTCDVGVYVGPGNSATISGAAISGFKMYGIFNDGGTVSVTGSAISTIGDSPMSGDQYGVGVYFVNPQLNASTGPDSPASGVISGNTITAYQKGGITVNGQGSSATVTDNVVSGVGQVPYIAQNGIQLGFGASGQVSGNTIDGNWYSGADWTSTGLLLFDVAANHVRTFDNHLMNNQTEFALVEDNSCGSLYGGLYANWGLCTVPVR
ncbi:MAG: right-handed parallel beta-helix repeat-containing protein [Acidimicrobiales bacterium]